MIMENFKGAILALPVFCFLWIAEVQALDISHEGGTITGTQQNFIFAKSIWTNTDAHKDIFKQTELLKYLFIDDISLSGSLQISSPLSKTGAVISLYRLDGEGSSYKSTLVKEWSGEHIIGRYYIENPTKYLVVADFPGDEYPHITFDFFPDNDSGKCINLLPSSGLSCDESWLPAHYRREIEPWIRGQFDEIRYRMGVVDQIERTANFTYFLIDSALDASSASNPRALIGKKVGQLAGAGLKAYEHDNLGFAVDQLIQHGIVIGQLFATGGADPSAWAAVAQQLTADAVSIVTSVSGILALAELEEKFNETRIAWLMLESFYQNNYGDYDSLAIFAGLDPASNPDIYDIIEGVASSLGYKNTLFTEDYNLEVVNTLFNSGVMDFGEWVFIRKSMPNPLNDVDEDGVLNTEDSEPNNPLIPQPEIIDTEPHMPVAEISTDSVSITVGTLVKLDGSSSSDPDGDSIAGTYKWILNTPNGSTTSLSSATGESVTFTPDRVGSYTAQLTVSDGLLSGEDSITVTVIDSYPEIEVDIEDDGDRHVYIYDLDVSPCTFKSVGSFTVPNGEKWRSIKIAGSREDIVLVARWGSPPSPRDSNWESLCERGYNIDDRFRGFEFNYRDSTRIITYDAGDKLPGEVLYIYAYSPDTQEGGGVSGYSVNSIVRVSYDLDEDGVPDYEEDTACLNNSNDSFDSDGDGICNNQDKFDNDPAASIDTDDDGYPDNWNSGKSELDSTMELVLDHPNFLNDDSEWADSDNDGVGDNADSFDNDIAASVDTDRDGAPDSWNEGFTGYDSTTGLLEDKFDNDPAASIDTDDDGYPDAWNAGQSSSDSVTGLTLDLFPDDPYEWADSDLDGFGDNSDWAPNEYSEWLDSDGDEVGDNADAAPNDPERSTNQAPIISDIENIKVGTGVSMEITLTITDSDGDTPTLVLLNAPSFVKLSDDSVTITPSIQDIGDFTVVVKVDDGFGGTDSQQFLISVGDLTPPTIIPPVDLNVAAIDSNGTPGSVSAISEFLTDVSAVDDVDGVISSINNDAPNIFPLGDTIVTFSATDNEGNEGSAQAVVTVSDLSAPEITLTGSSYITINLGEVFSDPGATAVDNVDGDISNDIQVSGSVDGNTIGEQILTYSVTDQAGNTSSFVTRTILVRDNVAPIVSVPSNISIAASNASGTAATSDSIVAFLSAATASDNIDGDVSVTHDAPLTFPIGLTLVTFRATDSAGNVASNFASVLVSDLTAPEVVLSGDDSITIDYGDTFNDPGAEATDNVDGLLTEKIQVAGLVDTQKLGVYTLTYTVTDSAGNTSLPVIRTVTVQDNELPQITTPSNIVVSATDINGVSASNSEIVSFLSSATAVDNVDGALSVDHDAPEIFPIGLTIVTFSATDSVGNVASGYATVLITTDDSDFDGLSDEVELELGLDPFDPSDATLDLDGDGLTNLQEYQQGSDILVDDVAPVLSVPSDIVINSKGPETIVDLGIATATDFKDGVIVPIADNTGPFVPGRHIVTWSATDEAGNTATATQIIDVIPQVSFSVSQVIDEGSSATVNISLNGVAINYPVTIPYTVEGSAESGTDHNLESGEILIASGTSAILELATIEDEIWEGDEDALIIMGIPTNAVQGSITEHTITLREENIAPIVNIEIRQSGMLATTVFGNAGDVELTANVVDPNPNDNHSLDWSLTSNSLLPTNGYNSTTFVFDPSELSDGMYNFSVATTDDGEGELEGSSEGILRVVSEAPILTNNVDSDGDGITDADEGVGDDDMDRIPDYLDSVDEPNQLPADESGAVMQTDTGLQLILGETAFASSKASAAVTMQDLDEHGGTGGVAGTNVEDEDYQFNSGIFDFEVSGSDTSQSVRIVLPQLAAIPENAVYRKYFADMGWAYFIEDAKNSIASAPGSFGVCPSPGDTSFVPGLSAGHFCVQLTIEDGGPNDTDGQANGIVKDPGGVAVQVIPAPTVVMSKTAANSSSFSDQDGEQVVLGFMLSSDSTDAEVRELTISASGELDETIDIGSVRLYRDDNKNGIPEGTERVAEGSYQTDNGDITFTLPEAYQLPVGETHYLVTYQF